MSGVVIFSSAALCSSADWNKSGEELNFKKDNQKVMNTKSMVSGVVIFSSAELCSSSDWKDWASQVKKCTESQCGFQEGQLKAN